VSADQTFTTATIVPPSGGFNRAILSITFDDGWWDTYHYALPALNSYGFTSTQYIITGEIGSDPYVGEAEIQEYAQSGHEIASHTVCHPHLPQVSASQLDSELSQSKATLESILGGTVTSFATPYGEYNSTVVSAIQKYYQSHRTVNAGYNSRANFDRWHILVQNMTVSTTLSEVQSWIQTALDHNYWLVLVYHKVGPNPGDQWDTRTENFLAQLDLISNSGITVETMRDALAEILPQLS
jgi:peptidoglycan/xylan/chitin deacetylase (PgdA/CDA1 family)